MFGLWLYEETKEILLEKDYIQDGGHSAYGEEHDLGSSTYT